MGQYFKYKIDKVKYKNIKEQNFFEVYGWCYAQNAELISYEVKVNNKDVLFEIDSIYRSDVIKEIKINDKEKSIGFYIRVDCLEDNVNKFELIARTEEHKETIIVLSSDEIKEIEDNHFIEFNIDAVTYEKEISMATAFGWTYSIDGKAVQIDILDKNKTVMDITCRKENRLDLIHQHLIQEDQSNCGFLLSFKYQEGETYYIQFKTENDVVTQKLEQTNVAYSSTLSKYIRHINKKNLQKGLAYLKKNGVKKLMYRLRYGTYVGESDYESWLFAQRVNEKTLNIQRNTRFSYSPKISILVATFNTKEEYLKEMIDTVVNQSYSNWELCIADGSTNDFVEKYVYEHYSSYGNKIKFQRLDQNYGISGNTNKAFEMATGDYITVYDHDDTLELDCFYEIVKALQEYRYDVLYTDEDRYDDKKKIYDIPNFKPDYNVDLLRSHNYITHLFVVSKRIIDEVGYYNSEYDGSQDYDYIFRCIEKANAVYHIPRVLYHWRMHPESTAQNPENKMYCYDAGKRAIEAHYQRIGVDATVEMLPKPMYGMYHTVYSLKDEPLISILIPNYNHKAILKTCIDSLYKVNTYQNFEIVIVENNSTEKEIFDYYKELQSEHDNIQVVTYKGEFNFSKINNYGMKYTKGDYVLLLNNDTEIMKSNAISEMVGCILRPEVGVVGARLLYADDTIQHAGIVLGFIGYAGHVNHGLSKDEHGYMNTECINGNYSAVTAACMMVKKSVFEKVGGFDEQFVVACNDVDLCLNICKENYLVVYNAFSLWHHYESKSRGYDDESQEKMWRFNQEVHQFQEKWKDVLENGDPYYNKNWNLLAGAFTLN